MPDSNPELAAQVQAHLRSTMLHHALSHLSGMDARTIAVLHLGGFLRDVSTPSLPRKTIEVLANPCHPRLISNEKGPLVFVKESERKGEVHNIADLLLNQDRDVRSVALVHLEQMVDHIKPALSKITTKGIQSESSALRSEDPDQWQRAAVKVSDSVNDDFACNVAGLRQSLAIGYQEGCNFYGLRALKPSTSSIEKIDLKVRSPHEERDEIAGRIVTFVNSAENLGDALSEYYDYCGHIPLGVDLSAGAVVKSWVKQREEAEDVWKAIWDWVEGYKTTPLPRYHACVALLENQDLVPTKRRDQFWAEIVQIISLSDLNSQENVWTQSWRIRQDLAKHYCHYLSCLFPGIEGERVAVLSWWMAEQVSSSFGSSAPQLKAVRNQAVRPTEDVSLLLDRLCHPPSVPSKFRYLTYWSDSLWAISLQCRIGKEIADLCPDEIGDHDREILSRSLTNPIAFDVLSRVQEAPRLYAFDYPGMKAVTKWAEIINDETGKAFASLVENIFSDISNPERVLESLSELEDGDEIRSILIVQSFSALVHSGAIQEKTIKDLWTHLCDERWRTAMFSKGSPGPLEIVIDALIELQVRTGGEWISHLPHFLAMACEHQSSDVTRRRFFFALTLASCLSTGTSSALLRLLKGKAKGCFSEDVDFWRKRLKSLQAQSPEWIACRMRAILAVLRP